MATKIEDLDAELARLQQEAAAVERAGPPFDEVWPEVERRLQQAEAVFRQYGAGLDGWPAVLPEEAVRRHQAAIGAAMVANGKALSDSERARVKAVTANGIAAADKRQRLDQIRAAILKAAARREIEARKVEGTEFMARPVHPELIVCRQGDLERLAAPGR